MIKNRAPPSRATPTTLCQKCLKRGHFSYECISSLQERPYASRASRSQQLANPKLRPKLDTTVPEEFLKKKETVQDPLHSKASKSDSPPRAQQRPRARSASISSVSTISTNRSHSPSHSPPARRSRKMAALRDDGSHLSSTYHSQEVSLSRSSRGTKRGRSRSSSPSHSTSRSPSPTKSRVDRPVNDDRVTRRRVSSISPATRGRAMYDERARQRRGERSSAERSSPSRRRRADSMDRSRVARERASWTSEAVRQKRIERVDWNANDRDQRVHSARYGRRDDINNEGNTSEKAPPRERSLSPYSRRLMLTKAMTGH